MHLKKLEESVPVVLGEVVMIDEDWAMMDIAEGESREKSTDTFDREEECSKEMESSDAMSARKRRFRSFCDISTEL